MSMVSASETVDCMKAFNNARKAAGLAAFKESSASADRSVTSLCARVQKVKFSTSLLSYSPALTPNFFNIPSTPHVLFRGRARRGKAAIPDRALSSMRIKRET